MLVLHQHVWLSACVVWTQSDVCVCIQPAFVIIQSSSLSPSIEERLLDAYAHAIHASRPVTFPT